MRITLNTRLQRVALERMRDGACALQVSVHIRDSHGIEKRCVKILRDLRENCEPDGILGSRSGYCDLEGFQVDLSAEINCSTVY